MLGMSQIAGEQNKTPSIYSSGCNLIYIMLYTYMEMEKKHKQQLNAAPCGGTTSSINSIHSHIIDKR